MMPATFAAVPQRTRNLTEVTRQVGDVQAAYVAITTEVRGDHAEAVGRLLEIANEAQGKRTFTEICGWPALERIYTRRLAHVQAGEERARELESRDLTSPLVQAATIAIAEADTVIRFEANLQEGAGAEGLVDILWMARSSQCSRNPQPNESKQTIQRLTQQLLLTPQAVTPAVRAPVIKPEAEVQSHREPRSSQASATPDFALGPGGSELQVAASNSGQAVVIASNGIASSSGVSFSSDYGDSFSPSTVNNTFNGGDPTLGTGASGNFYLGGLSLLLNGCSASVTADNSQTGKTFNFQGNAAVCPGTGSTCLPDQPQMAVDNWNATPSGDQLYMAWRNFPGSGLCVNILKGNPTPTISCSVDSGKTWQNQTLVGSGDRPRITVGKDGFVYATYVSGSSLQINKFSSCANGLQVQPHFPVTIASLSGVNCPMDGQFTNSGRCDSDQEASPQPAVSTELTGDVFVAYAESTSNTNDNIVVRHSRDGGLTWPDQAVANSAVAARRYLPWVCTTGGLANVSWYDRRAATPSDDSLTTYFFSRLSFYTNPPSLVGGEQNVSVSADSQKSATFNGDPKFGDYNGNACAGSRAFVAWASATPPPGVTNPGGIQVYAATLPPGPPIVASVSPSGGGCGGSTKIVIKGSNFVNVGSVMAVPQDLTYPAIPLTGFTVVSNKQITATVPSTLQAGLYEIVVQTPSGGSVQPVLSSRTDLFGVGPTVTSINPNVGAVPGGTEVTVNGTCFGTNPNAVQVYFGGSKASKGFNQCASSTQCVVYSPSATSSSVVDVVVSVDGVNSPTTFADKFTYAGPMITHLNPNHGPRSGGTEVIISGAGFPPYTGNPDNLQVSFGQAPAGALCLGSSVYATTSCSVVTPAVSSPEVVDVVAHAFGVSSSVSQADHFTYDEFPALINFQPPAQSAIFLNGNAPQGGAAVNISSSDSSVVQLPQPVVTISAGAQSALVPLTILPTPQVKQIELTASYQGSFVKTSFTVGASPALSITTPTTLDVNESGTVTVTLNTPAPAGGATVTLSSSDPSAIALPTSNSVTIPPGSFSKDFTITNKYSGSPKAVKISAGHNGATASDFVLVPATTPCLEKVCPRGTSWDAFQCRCVRGETQ